MATFIAFVSAARPKVSYESMMLSNGKRWLANFSGVSLPWATSLTVSS